MDAKALRYFEAVARYGSMKRAATELNTVQSNVTARIRSLENELNVSLFERRPDGMALTPAGVRLLPHAFEVRAAVESAKRAAKDEGVPQGPLVIGVRKSTTAMHLTNLLSRFVPAFPNVEISVRTETSPVLTDLVLERRLEAAFVCDPVQHSDLASEVIFDEELVVLTPPNVIDLKQLSPNNSRMVVLGQGSLYQMQLAEVLARQGIVLTRVLELGTLEAIIGCVSGGLGVTLLPKNGFGGAAYKNKVRVHEITDASCRVQTLFIRRQDGFVSSALSAFVNCARAYAKSAEEAGNSPNSAAFARAMT